MRCCLKKEENDLKTAKHIYIISAVQSHRLYLRFAFIFTPFVLCVYQTKVITKVIKARVHGLERAVC